MDEEWTGLDILFQVLAVQINNSKRKEARYTPNVDCRNLAKELLAALAKVSKRMEKLHLKILLDVWTGYTAGLCLKKIGIYIESSLYSRQLLGRHLGYCWVETLVPGV